jgi:NhaA family Na+:H+ antiporter
MVCKHLGFRPNALAACAPWQAFQHSGIHPALALSPIVLTIPHANVNFAVFSEAKAQLHNLLNDIERKLKRPVEVILVFFSLANAGAELYRRRHRAGACGPAGPQAGGGFADGWSAAKPMGLGLPDGMRVADPFMPGCVAAIGFRASAVRGVGGGRSRPGARRGQDGRAAQLRRRRALRR